MSKNKKIISSAVFIFGFSLLFPNKTLAFRFAAWADTKSGTTTLKAESLQLAPLNPVFTLFPGDVCDSGPNQTCFTPWLNAINGGTVPGNGMFNKTFAARGNHDSSGASFWVANFDVAGVASRVGATNLSQLNTDLTYSFDYDNSHFVLIDIPSGGVAGISAAQITWLDNDLTAAANRGLTHAFLSWHGPVYPVANHCCETNPALNAMLNKHTIVSATFHGHEHVVTHTHIDSSRIPGVTHEYEQIVSGDAGAGPSTAQANRVDWWLGNSHGFTTVDVNGNTFTVNFYKLGLVAPVKTMTFTKSGGPGRTPIPTPTGTGGKPGDVNGDNSVNIIDIGLIIDNYDKLPIQNPKTDLNRDGRVNIIDIGIVIDNYSL
jgi:hypothetical protein